MTTTPDGRPAFHAQFYSHDSVGFGHVRRNLALANALARELPVRTGMPGVGLVLTGEPEAARFPRPNGFDVLVLPGITKRGRQYAPRHAGFALDDLVDMRGSLLNGLWAAEAPDLLVIDRHVFGIDGELKKGLKKLRKRSPHTKVVLGLREVLDSPEVVAKEWAAVDPQSLDRIVDEVWVYGDAAVHNAAATGELPQPLAQKAFFTGYLANGRPTSAQAPEHRSDERLILTTAGAGSDGLPLTLAAARAEVPAGMRHVVVTGPQLPQARHDQVVRAARPGTEVLRSADVAQLMDDAHAVITMGGYNSVCEVLASTAPALIVPRVVPRLEQEIRARSLEKVGAVDVLHPRDLTAEALSGWLARSVGSDAQRIARRSINLDGLANVANHVVTTMAKEPIHV
ncbi:glycosyltransferase family protein [Tessaracoccus massiliensis]|uniref:glycosyltransferase family protein n=1 Tax=Tessaracoccus massiliensis TaxID=1522311 RepID=UPI000693D4AA|nr:glycosyltransferase [Tessaracoccus massiliensis]